MLLRRVIKHFRNQEWTAIGIDFVIVVFGVFVGIQVANWNEAYNDRQRKAQIVDGLVTYLSDVRAVQTEFVAEIETGLLKWQEAFDRGESPIPYYYRHSGSDAAPNGWSTFEQMQLTNLFDSETIFDLVFFHNELGGIDQKYIRYVTFLEDRVLPGVIEGTQAFYDDERQLKPEFMANMDRLRDYQRDSKFLAQWINCLIYRLQTKRHFSQNCYRSDFQLEGMENQALLNVEP